MYFKLPTLPFDPTQVLGWISTETIDFHYGRHHSSYVDKLNLLLPKSGFEESTLEEIILQSDGTLYNNAAQAWNHTFYWKSIAGDSYHNKISNYPELKELLNNSFGSLENFEDTFSKNASSLFGSGWVWLVKNHQTSKLEIISTANADNPIRQEMLPLIACDVWEHAYYIDFRNSRIKYIEGFLKMINWGFAATNFNSNEVCNLTSMMRG